MNKTKIEWCDSTWNPVTGCLNDCEYCYARRTANRFKITGYSRLRNGEYLGQPRYDLRPLFDLTKPIYYEAKSGKLYVSPYPFDFRPSFHRYRLDDYKSKSGRTIFVCSMADLFGEWVPDKWIAEVFMACEAAPQHRYLFLTKNPKRYIELAEKGMLPQSANYWFGSTATTQDTEFWWSNDHSTFVSIEPILGEFEHIKEPIKKVDWIIIGVETGDRKNKVIPRREWVENIVENCRATGTPVFMKNSLRDIMGENFIQEFPW